MDEPSIAKVQSARRKQSKASLEIWNTRLSLLRSIGDYRALLDHISSPAELAGNNCECNNGCNVPCGSNCGSLGLASVIDPPFEAGLGLGLVGGQGMGALPKGGG